MKRNRKTLAFLISGLLIFTIPFHVAAGEYNPACIEAAEKQGEVQEEAAEEYVPETSGLRGEELYGEYTEGVLNISGAGSMYDSA